MNPVWTDKPRVSLWVDADDPIVSQHLIQAGDWDAPLADFLEEALQPDDVFLDLGAHCGYFSLVAARKCKKVIAVEPQADMCDLIHMSGQKNVEVKQVAVGVTPGYWDLFIPPNRGAANFHHGIGYTERVQMVELKDVSDGATVVKIDIEGDDPDLLAANPEFLRKVEVLVFEYQPNKIDGPKYFDQIKAAGFEIYRMSGEHRTEPPSLPEGFYTNLVGIREDMNGRA